MNKPHRATVSSGTHLVNTNSVPLNLSGNRLSHPDIYLSGRTSSQGHATNVVKTQFRRSQRTFDQSKDNDVTNKTSKILRSTAAAGVAAILTFGVGSVHEAAAAQTHTVQAPAVRNNGSSAYGSSGPTTGAAGAPTTILAGRAPAAPTRAQRAPTRPGRSAAIDGTRPSIA
jgi:hypothetical protein